MFIKFKVVYTKHTGDRIYKLSKKSEWKRLFLNRRLLSVKPLTFNSLYYTIDQDFS